MMERPNSEVQIANLALDKCKCGEIGTFDDPNKRARAVRRHFGAVRDALLRRMDWNFASTWVWPPPIALPAPMPTAAGRFKNRFVMPAECLAVREVENLSDAEWECERSKVGYWTPPPPLSGEMEAMVLTCDIDNPHVRYTACVRTVAVWDPLFANAFVALLAAAIAPKVARTTAEARGYTAEAEGILVDLAKKADSKERARARQMPELASSSWIAARFGFRRAR